MGPKGNLGIFLRVASTALSPAMMRKGSTVKLQIREKVTPLERTMPRSAPIFSLMKHSIIRLTMVVKALLRMEDAPPRMAPSMAVSLSFPRDFSCR